MTKIAFKTFIQQVSNKLGYVFTVLMIASPLSKLPATNEGGLSHIDWSGCDW